MRAAGKQYKEISAELGIEVSALKVFVHRQKKPGTRKCAMCGKRLPDKARESQRFCSIIAIFKNLTNTSKSETNADNQKE